MNVPRSRHFAIVPAAGRSTRMGRPKLLLPWKGQTVIQSTLAAWQAAGVTRTTVVVRPGDDALAAVARTAGADVIVPTVPPPEMRDSIQFALEHLARTQRPSDFDTWLVAPADMPQLSADVIHPLLCAHDPTRPRILAPVYEQRRGHPVLFPWPLAAELPKLPPDVGLNELLNRYQWTGVPVSAPTIHGDLDAPEDYARYEKQGH